MESDALRDTRIEGLSDDLSVPRKNGELQFEAPWEARVFGMAVAMYDDRQFVWDDFRTRLVQEIADAEAHCDDSGYYERWLGSFERLLLETGVLSPDELDRRTAEFAAGVWDPHEHYETTSDATASSVRSPLRSGQRNIVRRSDGEAINVFRRPGQLFVCAGVAEGFAREHIGARGHFNANDLGVSGQRESGNHHAEKQPFEDHRSLLGLSEGYGFSWKVASVLQSTENGRS